MANHFPWGSVFSTFENLEKEIQELQRQRSQAESSIEQWESKDSMALVLRRPGINSRNTTVTLEGRELAIVSQPTDIVPEGYTKTVGAGLSTSASWRYRFTDKYDLDRLEAKILDGQLLVTIPRVVPVKTSRTVPIN